MSSTKKEKKNRGQSSYKRRLNLGATLGICLVVCMIAVFVGVKGKNLRDKIAANEERAQQLTAQIADEEDRTGEIEEQEEYMQSDEYTEKIAKEKIGLVKDNEIIFKESDQ